MRRSSKSGVLILSTLLVAGIMVFVLPSGPASASSLVPASQPASSWSYGVVKTITVPTQDAPNGWQYQGNATFGYAVTIFENSTNATTFELTVFRTMGLSYSVQFCYPLCSAAHQWANETFRLYESTATFANFTTAGVVYVSPTSTVTAIALENTTSFLHANLTESTDVYIPGIGEKGPHLGYLGANLLANSAVSFSPAFGILPTQLSPGESWNSTSAFSAKGSASWAYYYGMIRPANSYHFGPKSNTTSLKGQGSVSLQGSYPANSTFQYGGTTYPAVVLSISGPFDVREGIVFIPSPVDVFGSSVQPWDGNQTGSASAQSATLDLKSAGGDLLQPIGSSLRYASATSNAASTVEADPGSSGLALATSGASPSPVASGTLQGVPMTQDQAASAQNCLTSGGGCPAVVGPSTTPPIHLLGAIVVAGVVVTAGAVAALAVVSRRRRSPPPVYPNAVLYPPGAAYPSAPAGAPPSPGAPPPPDDDPLDHLW